MASVTVTVVALAVAVVPAGAASAADRIPQGDSVWISRDAAGYAAVEVYRRSGDRLRYYQHGTAGGATCSRGRLDGDRYTGRTAVYGGAGVESWRTRARIVVRDDRVRWIVDGSRGDSYRRVSGPKWESAVESLATCTDMFAQL